MDKKIDIMIPDKLSPESAKELFFACGCNYRKIPEVLGDRYNEYKSIVDGSRSEEKWASEECERVLKNIAEGNIDNYCQDLINIGHLAEVWISDGELLHPELLTSAWKTIIANCKDEARICVGEKYLDRFRVAEIDTKKKLLPLLDMFRDHIKHLTREQLYMIGYHGGREEFRHTCANLRRQINEASLPENNSFRFVRTSAAYLDIIVGSLMQKWNSTDTVKSSTSEMNCAWGVENNEMYVTGVSSATRDAEPRSFDILEYIAVIPKERQAYLFRCRLDEDGVFAVNVCEPEAKSLIPQLEEAVALYRSRTAQNDFFKENGIAYWYNELEDRLQEYLSRFPKVYRDVYARIPECSIKDTLIFMVDIAEEQCGEYGGSADDFKAPATDTEIAEWEKAHGIKIPDDYKEFLRFSNGVTMPDRTEFSGLNDLGSYIEYLKDEGSYCDAGSFIGDGTMLCFNDEGDFYEWQDGEMICLGSFDEAVRYICEL